MALIFIVELRDDSLPKAQQVNDALRSELPASFPDYDFEFGYSPGEGGGITPLVGTAGDTDNPGHKFKEQAIPSDLRELRLRAFEIVAEALARKPS